MENMFCMVGRLWAGANYSRSVIGKSDVRSHLVSRAPGPFKAKEAGSAFIGSLDFAVLALSKGEPSRFGRKVWGDECDVIGRLFPGGEAQGRAKPQGAEAVSPARKCSGPGNDAWPEPALLM